ncbi:restriction endonuclease subunit S [Finegoldia magna]|uniref:restriction endonuclease subunit S n=1 Tax=Finegoldia magna TaxID=1260 RepID=UPI000763E682|nr:restriction endonuclease subunit S [Finegoldia magna]KXA09358.1 type I restriction modification DNA specificity domain protein [Finegoldia magna]MDU5186746.1 restriction endonuclease subunit S [Finegoldia magna]
MEYRICEIGEVVGGGTPSTKRNEYWNGCIPWISPKDLTSHTSVYISHGKKFITKEGLKAGSTLLPQNTVLMSSRAPIGYLAIAENELCTNQGFKSIVCNEEKVVPLYLYYYLKANIEYIRLFGTGATFPEISAKTLRKIKINIEESTEKQNRIATVLSNYDNLIENNNKRIKLLEQMAENLYKEWFVRFRFPGYEDVEFEDGIPKGWKICRIDQLSKIKAGGDAPDDSTKEITDECSIPIYSNGIENEGLYGYTSKAKINNPSITISARGTVGYTCLRRIPYTPIVRLISIIPHEENLVNWLFYYFRRSIVIANGTSQQQITIPMISREKVLLPTNNLIQKFYEYSTCYLDEIDSLKAQSSNLEKQRDLLLPRLMSGKLEV